MNTDTPRTRTQAAAARGFTRLAQISQEIENELGFVIRKLDTAERELAAAKENSNGLMKLYNKTKEELEKYQQFDGNDGIKCMVEVAKERDQLRAELEQVKAQRNKVGMEVRAEYLPKLTACKEQLALAERCVEDLRKHWLSEIIPPEEMEITKQSLAAYDKFKEKHK